MPMKNNPYYAIYMKSVPRPDIPVPKGYLRTETIKSGWIIERDPHNPKNTIINAVTHSDFKGSVPGWIMQRVAAGMPKKVMSIFLEGYRKYEAEVKGKAVTKK